MSEWQIRIPLRTKTDTLADVGSNASVLSEDDRRITREAVLVAAQAGVQSAQELTELIEDMTPTERRFTLDKLRQRVGLKTASAQDAAEAAEQRAQQNRAWSAQNPGPLRLALNPSGTGFIDVDEQMLEAHRQAAEEQFRRHEREAREQARALEAREREAFDAAGAEKQRSELPEEFRGLLP